MISPSMMDCGDGRDCPVMPGNPFGSAADESALAGVRAGEAESYRGRAGAIGDVAVSRFHVVGVREAVGMVRGQGAHLGKREGEGLIFDPSADRVLTAAFSSVLFIRNINMLSEIRLSRNMMTAA
jgi:hypothetical protein